MERNNLGASFVQALSGGNWNALQVLFQPSIKFRALIPPGLRKASSDAEASGHFRRWFGKADAVELVDFAVEPLFDKLRIAYRLRLHEDRWYGCAAGVLRCNGRPDRKDGPALFKIPA